MNLGRFKNSWWVKKWLEALLQGVPAEIVDTAWRYLDRGQLTSLEFTDNRIVSKLKGPNGGMHGNYILFPRVEKSKTEVFASLLKQQPTELRALLNGSLSPSLELILAKCGITLFDSIDAVKMDCDCKDQNPCKYVVLVFLGIATQMTDNPFVLFKIHGMDLEYLKDLKIEDTPAESSDAPVESSIVQGITLRSVDAAGAPAEGTAMESGRIPDFDFSKWRDYSQILPAMLPNFPDFCPAGNFRKSFADEMNFCRSYFASFESFENFTEQFRLYHNKTFMMEGESLRVYHSAGWKWRFEQANEGQVISSGLSTATAIGALCVISQGNFFMHHVTVRFLYRVLMGAFYLIRTGAIYPQVFWIGGDVAQVRWLPAEMLPDVLSAVAEFEKYAPQKLAFTTRDEEVMPLVSPAEHVLSLFIGQLLRFARKFKPMKQKSRHENLLSFFFDCVSGKLANNAHAIPGKIQKWFSVYSSLDYRTQILFACAEVGNEVALDVFVLNGSADSDTAVRTPIANLFKENDARLLSVLNILNGVAEVFKPMGAYIERRGASPIIMKGNVLLEFLENCLDKLQILGIQTEIPKNLLNRQKPKPRMRIQGSFGFGTFTTSDLLDFDWEISIGDETMDAAEFLKLAEQADGLLKFKSQYVQVSEADLQALRDRVEGKNADDAKKNAPEDTGSSENGDAPQEDPPAITQVQLLQACFTGECNNIPIDLATDTKAQIDAWRAETEIALPEGLNATLRPYQERGYSWMYKNLEIGCGCILADDMGLGKTLQVITFLLKIKQEGKLDERKALVVMPAGLLCNWQVEITKFAPDLKYLAYHGGSRDLQKFNADVLLTTYATFRRDYELLEARPWQAIVIDEAQNIKNADSEQSKLLRKMQAPMKIAMSGTPVENRLMEFWTIMDFCNQGFFPSPTEFREKYETPIQKENNERVAETFKKITAPFMLRRLKTDKSIISDLPDKIIQDEYAELTKAQAALYQKTLEHFMQELEMEQALSEKANDAHALFKRKGIILQMILALKQICNHPATFLKGAASEQPEESAQALSSGKMQMLLDLLTSIQEQGEKTLIFTQFAEMGFLLEKTITEELGLHTHFYHGGCTQTQRTTMIEDFQKNPECKVLILSLKAGGTGLNLTAASQVIHYDLWWNPAIEAQATDRAFRIGQTRNVQVHRFITKGTFEEKINALLETKKSIANMTVSAGETWLADMDDKQLGEVFGLDNTLV